MITNEFFDLFVFFVGGGQLNQVNLLSRKTNLLFFDLLDLLHLRDLLDPVKTKMNYAGTLSTRGRSLLIFFLNSVSDLQSLVNQIKKFNTSKN